MAKAKKLPSGNWRVQASKADASGKLIKKSFTRSDRRSAEAAAAEWQAEITADMDTESITLGTAFDRYINSRENVLSAKTIREYRGIRRRELQDIMNIRIDRITRESVQRSINLIAPYKSPKTIRNIHGLLSAVLKMFRPDLSLYTALPQKEQAEPNVPEEETVSALMRAIKGTKLEIPVLLAAFGPLRRGEICALDLSEDLDGNILSVRKSKVQTTEGNWIIKKPKTDAGYRYVDLPDFVVEILRTKEGAAYDGSPDSLTLAFRKALIRAGIKPFRFHDLRHYNASILHAMGIPDKYIMARGGWKSQYTLQRIYTHALKSQQSEFDKKISQHFEEVYK